MPYQLILTVYEGTTVEQMLSKANFTVNAKFLHTYTIAPPSQQEENPIQSAKMPIKLTLHNQTQDQNLQRCLQLFFSNKASIRNFLEALPKSAGIDFRVYRYYAEEEGNFIYVARIISNILSPTSFEQLQSSLISHFDLDTKSATAMFMLAGPVSTHVLKLRQALISSFEEILSPLRANISAVYPLLLTAAKNYDKTENLGQNAATLGLGYILLSLKLSSYAERTLKKIKKNMANKEYILAQIQLMQLYCLSDKRNDLKKCFIAALECDNAVQATLCANLLSGFKSPNQFFINSDFQYKYPHQDSEKNLNQDTHVLFKMFAKINKQQQAIKELKLSLQATLNSTISDHIQLMNAVFNSFVKTSEQNFIQALEMNDPTHVAHYANLLCGFHDSDKLFSIEDFDCITQGSDNEDEHEDQDITTDVLFTVFDKISTQEQEIKRLEANIATKKTLPDLADTPFPPVIYIFSNTADTEIKTEHTPPPRLPLIRRQTRHLSTHSQDFNS